MLRHWEGGIRIVFWAWPERKKVILRFKDAGRAELVKEREAWLAAVRERARADGIDLDKYLKP